MATIYKILSPCLKECYIGSTVERTEVRWTGHRCKSNTTTSRILFERYGKDCKFVALEVCPLEERFIREQWWMEHSVGVVNRQRSNITSEKRFEENRERAKAYYEANRETVRAKNRERGKAYYEANRETVRAKNRERGKAYYEEKREEILARRRGAYTSKMSE